MSLSQIMNQGFVMIHFGESIIHSASIANGRDNSDTNDRIIVLNHLRTVIKNKNRTVAGTGSVLINYLKHFL